MDLVWRPARRTLVVAGLWLLLAILSAYAFAALDLIGAIYPLTVAVLAAGYYLVLAVRGCTEFTADAVHNTLLRTATIPWDEVDRIRVVRLGRATWLQLVLDRRRVRLAAPRTGLIAKDAGFADHLAEVRAAHDVTESRIPGWLGGCAAVLAVALVAVAMVTLDRPWLSDWWPGTHVATATPAPCHVFDQPTLTKALTDHHDAGTPTSAFLGDGCQWQRLGDLGWDLVVSYDRFARGTRTSSTTEAEDGLATFAGHEDQRELPGLGDHAYAHTSGSITSVLVRRANVIVEVEYNGDPATAVELAGAATAALRVD